MKEPGLSSAGGVQTLSSCKHYVGRWDEWSDCELLSCQWLSKVSGNSGWPIMRKYSSEGEKGEEEPSEGSRREERKRRKEKKGREKETNNLTFWIIFYKKCATTPKSDGKINAHPKNKDLQIIMNKVI